MKISARLVSSLFLFVLATAIRADVSLPRVFGDNMVLQRGVPVPIWGRAAPGEKVVVRFAGQEKAAQAGTDGCWVVVLDPLQASVVPREMTVAGVNVIQFRNILAGEVWLCSGQSNMEYAVGVAKAWAPPAAQTDPELAQEIKGGALPSLRLFRSNGPTWSGNFP
jgi:sialate O-acetylesterase